MSKSVFPTMLSLLFVAGVSHCFDFYIYIYFLQGVSHCYLRKERGQMAGLVSFSIWITTKQNIDFTIHLSI